MLTSHLCTEEDYHPLYYLEPIGARQLHTSINLPPIDHRNSSKSSLKSGNSTISSTSVLKLKKSTVAANPPCKLPSDTQPKPALPRPPLKELQVNKQPSTQAHSTSMPNNRKLVVSSIKASIKHHSPPIKTNKNAQTKCPTKSQPSNENQAPLKCIICGKQYSHRSSLFKHMKKLHPACTSSGHIQCKEENCSFKCTYIAQLREHLIHHHSFCIDSEELSFQSEQGMCIHNS